MRGHRDAAGARQRDHRRAHRRGGRAGHQRRGGGAAAGRRRLPDRPRSRPHGEVAARGGPQPHPHPSQPSQPVRPRAAHRRRRARRGRHRRSILRGRRPRHGGVGAGRRNRRAHRRDRLRRPVLLAAAPGAGDRRGARPRPAGDRRRRGPVAAAVQPARLHRRRRRPGVLLRGQGDRRAAGDGHPVRPPPAGGRGGAAALRPGRAAGTVAPAVVDRRRAAAGRRPAPRHRPPLQGRQGADRRPAGRPAALRGDPRSASGSPAGGACPIGSSSCWTARRVRQPSTTAATAPRSWKCSRSDATRWGSPPPCRAATRRFTSTQAACARGCCASVPPACPRTKWP